MKAFDIGKYKDVATQTVKTRPFPASSGESEPEMRSDAQSNRWLGEDGFAFHGTVSEDAVGPPHPTSPLARAEAGPLPLARLPGVSRFSLYCSSIVPLLLDPFSGPYRRGTVV